MQLLRITSLVALAAILNACSSGVDMPSGTSKGYSSARLVARKASAPASTAEEAKVHGMIQRSIAAQFKTNGLDFNKTTADLVVTYLVVYQDNAMTTYFDEFYGYGRDPEAISDAAHKKNVIDGKRPDAFERAGVVVDIVDARTNKLVYRSFGAGDIVRGIDDTTRAKRVNAAVNTALAPFFRK